MKLGLISGIIITGSIAVLVYLVYKLRYLRFGIDLTGIWSNDYLNIRILIHGIDSVFHGSVIWANGIDKLLGMRVIENLRFNKLRVANGQYADPITGRRYHIKLNLVEKGKVLIQAYHHDTGNFAFTQEWRLVNY